MAAPLSLTVDAASKKRAWRGSFLALAASLGLQGTALFFLGVTPLLDYGGLPTPQSAAPLKAYVPVVPATPPALSQGPRRTRAFDASRLLHGFRAPIMVANEIGSEDFEHFQDTTIGVPFGFEFGVPESRPEHLPRVDPNTGPPARPIVAGVDVRPPQKRRHVNPIYPAIALPARVQGTVVLEATIDEKGDATNVRILKSIPLLDAAAVDAVRQWKYVPTLLNERPVPVLLTVTVKFELGR